MYTWFREKIFIDNSYCGLTRTKTKNAAYPISAYAFYRKLENEEKSYNDNLDMRERHPTTCANQPSLRKLSLDRPSATLFASTDSLEASNTISICEKIFTVNSFISDSGNVYNINQMFHKYFRYRISKKRIVNSFLKYLLHSFHYNKMLNELCNPPMSPNKFCLWYCLI